MELRGEWRVLHPQRAVLLNIQQLQEVLLLLLHLHRRDDIERLAQELTLLQLVDPPLDVRPRGALGVLELAGDVLQGPPDL